MKSILVAILLIALISTSLAAPLTLYGATREDAVWKGNNLWVAGAPVLSAADSKVLQKDPGLAFVATVDFGTKKGSKAKPDTPKIYVIGTNLPKEFIDNVSPSALPKALTSDLTPSLTSPLWTSTGGRTVAQWYMGRKWTTPNPQIKLYVNPTRTGLSNAAVQAAVEGAAKTWDDATNQNLFVDSNLVTVSTDQTIAAIGQKYDQKNTISWNTFGSTCNALAMSGSWYRVYRPDKTRYAGTVADPYPIIENDILFNANYKWLTAGAPPGYDVQTVALHELGHTLGLADIYGRTGFSGDSRQVMHYYTGVKRTLGNGDAVGVFRIYG